MEKRKRGRPRKNPLEPPVIRPPPLFEPVKQRRIRCRKARRLRKVAKSAHQQMFRTLRMAGTTLAEIINHNLHHGPFFREDLRNVCEGSSETLDRNWSRLLGNLRKFKVPHERVEEEVNDGRNTFTKVGLVLKWNMAHLSDVMEAWAPWQIPEPS